MEISCQEDTLVLYTAQKHKKNKTWQDGKIKIIDNKVILMDMEGKKLDSFFKKNLSDEVETDRYLIQIEQTTNNENSVHDGILEINLRHNKLVPKVLRPIVKKISTTPIDDQHKQHLKSSKLYYFLSSICPSRNFIQKAIHRFFYPKKK
jgi:hypothetical protein